MSIADQSKHDDQGLTVEYVERQQRTLAKIATQMNKLQDAYINLKRVATNRGSYNPTPEQWERVLHDARAMFDDLEATAQTAPKARGARWEW